MIVATAGHVDHGKTSLIRNLTGVETDRLAEEKQRGLSIEAGYAYEQTASGRTIGYVDVPGHTAFLRNMLAGVSSVDAAMLVVAADDGIMPQTREHLDILHLLGINRGVVALTRIDRVGPDRMRTVATAMEELLAGTSLEGAAVVPVCNTDGRGVEAVRTLLHGLAEAEEKREPTGFFRMSIDRVFTVAGTGTVVTGTVVAGRVRRGDRLVHAGSGQALRVRGLRLDQQDLGEVEQGSRVALNITLPRHRIGRGDWLVHPAIRIQPGVFDASLLLTEGCERPVRSGLAVHLHSGAARVMARLVLPGRKEGRAGQRLMVRLRPDEPLHILHRDRFVLRDPGSGRILGGGRVLDIFPPKRGAQSPEHLERLRALDAPAAKALEGWLPLLPRGVALDRARQMFNRPEADLTGDGTARRVLLAGDPPWLLDQDRFDELGRHLTAVLRETHLQQPGLPGLDPQQLAGAAGLDIELTLQLGERLLEDGVLTRSGTQLHLPDHDARLDPLEEDCFRRVAALMEERRPAIPRARELARELDVTLPFLITVLRGAASRGELVRLTDDRYYPLPALQPLGEIAGELAAASPAGAFSVREYRDRSGMGRNLCIEVLEYFDRRGLTKRDGNVRSMEQSPADFFQN